tara:strand:+ start:610 stop:750 length:141 start_codon:yes stop_codon:yes gene_type:complete
MTRISASVKPIELCDKMLMAEHRECIERGFKVQDYSSCFLNLPSHL